MMAVERQCIISAPFEDHPRYISLAIERIGRNRRRHVARGNQQLRYRRHFA